MFFAKVIEELNAALSEELTAINQYFLHAEMCENWGFEVLSENYKKISIDEMKHAEAIIERILFLEGMPNMSKYQKMTIGRKIPEMLKNDLKLEVDAVAMYNKSITLCAKNNDHVTAELFKKFLKDEEEHADFFEEQLELIEMIGMENYLQKQTGDE